MRRIEGNVRAYKDKELPPVKASPTANLCKNGQFCLIEGTFHSFMLQPTVPMPEAARSLASSDAMRQPSDDRPWLDAAWPVLGRLARQMGMTGRAAETFLQTLAAIAQRGDAGSGLLTLRAAMLDAAALRGVTFVPAALVAQWAEAVLDAGLHQLKRDPLLERNTFAVFEAYALGAGSSQDIAARYGTSENAVYQIKNRGMRKLRALFDQIESDALRGLAVTATGFPATSTLTLDMLRGRRPGGPLERPIAAFARRVALVLDAARLGTGRPTVAWRAGSALRHATIDGLLLLQREGRTFRPAGDIASASLLVRADVGGGIHAQPGPHGVVLRNGEPLESSTALVDGDVLEVGSAAIAFSAA